MSYENYPQQDTVRVSPGKEAYKFIFNETAESKTYYLRSINQAINSLMEHLETRHTPFSGASIAAVKDKFAQAYIDDSSYGTSLHNALEELKPLYLDDAISFHNKQYVAHLNCPILVPTLAAEILISALNTSMDTWDQSAGATFIEQKLIDWTLDKIGYPSHSDGIFTSGGTQSNLMGLLLARDHYSYHQLNWDPKLDGLPPEAARFRIFCSEVAHFSLKKNASILGLGQRCIIPVPVDAQYKMDAAALERMVVAEKENGNLPIAVVGTAGTTDFGSIDPLNAIARIADQQQLWFHVDAAYGGGLILSEHHEHKLEGIALSDSATIDYHKTFFQPVCSSGFLMRDKAHAAFIKYNADYLNPEEHDAEGVPNMVGKSIQTTRRFDALKLWMTLRVLGKKRLGQYIDSIIDLADSTYQLLKADAHIEVLNQPEFSALVFRYLPIHEHKTNICELNTGIRRAMFQQGNALLASTKVEGKVYLKFTLLNPTTTVEDMQQVLHLIREHGNALARKSAPQNTQVA